MLAAAAALCFLRRRRAKVAAEGPWAPVPACVPLRAPAPSARVPPARAPLRAPAAAAGQGVTALGALAGAPRPSAPPRAAGPPPRPPAHAAAPGGGPPRPAPARATPRLAPLLAPLPAPPPRGAGGGALRAPRPPAHGAPPAPLRPRPALPQPRLPRRAAAAPGPLPSADLIFVIGALDCGFVDVPDAASPLVLDFDEEKLPGFAGSTSVSARIRVRPHPVPRGGAGAAWARGSQKHGKAAAVVMPGCRGARLLAAARFVEDEWKRRTLRGGFAVLGARVDTPCGSLPVLADELPVSPYARRDEPVWVRNWAPAPAPRFLLAKITELTIGGHSDIVRVRLDGTTDKGGLVDVHRSRMVLKDPKKKDARGSRARPPGGVEALRAAPGGGDGEKWKVTWHGGVTTVEGAGVVWHLAAGGRALAETVLDVPWGHKQ